MGSGQSREKQQLTDEEYLDYLTASRTFCGRLWANMIRGSSSNEEGEEEETSTSMFSITELYKSLLELDENALDEVEEEEEEPPEQREPLQEEESFGNLSSFSSISLGSVGTGPFELDEDHHFSFSEFEDDLLSSTFIIEEDPDFLALSRDEFFDPLDEREFRRRVIIQDLVLISLGSWMTNPSA